MTLRDRVALVTGASRGLGRAIARHAAQQGARLIITARDAEALGAVAAELDRRTAVFALAGDVADPQHVERLVREGTARLGAVEVLVNNASDLGATPLPVLKDYPLGPLERAFRVNTFAPLHLTQLVLPAMLSGRRGVVINITSDAAVEAYPGWGGYGASKAALEAFSRVLGAELEGSGVRVYAVDPGDMNTRMHEEADPGADFSALAEPEVVAPVLFRLFGAPYLPAGRYTADGLRAALADSAREVA
jgi:short-subunit dehydrogenase